MMANVIIDIGHGSNTFPPDKGVYRNGKGYAEHGFNSKLAVRIKELLEENGHHVDYGPQKPFARNVGLTTRTNYYNRQDIDLVVSLHANAGVSSASGRCGFYWHDSAEGKRLAQSIINEIKGKGYNTHGSGLHASIRGSWTNLHIVRETKAPATLIEHGFMTNDSDFELIFGSKQDEYIEDMAQADVAGIVKYLGGKPVEPSKPSQKPAPKPSSDNSVAGARLVKNENAYFLATENIKVRNAPSTTATHTGTLPEGSSINYHKVYEGNGYRWLQYVGNSGNTLYLPYRPSNDIDNQWGTFHGSRPSGGSKTAPEKDSAEQVAQDIANGRGNWGNNPQRAQKLKEAGYNATAIQNRVNEILGAGSSSGSSSQSVKAGDTVTAKALYSTAQSTKNVRSSNIKGYVADIDNNRRNPIRLRNKKGGYYLGFTRQQDLV